MTINCLKFKINLNPITNIYTLGHQRDGKIDYFYKKNKMSIKLPPVTKVQNDMLKSEITEEELRLAI